MAAFISYSWANKDLVRRIKSDLSLYNVKVWIDIEQIKGGQWLHEKIVEGIRTSKIFVCGCSPNYVASENCNVEIELANDWKIPIIPLWVDKLSEWPPTNKMAVALAGKKYIDFTKTAQYAANFEELLQSISSLGIFNAYASFQKFGPESLVEHKITFTSILKQLTRKANNTQIRQYQVKKGEVPTAGNVHYRKDVELPEGADPGEWLAMHTVERLSDLQEALQDVFEHCTPSSCPTMNAGDRYEFRWSSEWEPAPKTVSAPEYYYKCMFWVQMLMNDPKMFPETLDQSFPINFREIVSEIMKRLFRIYAHIYSRHAYDVKRAGSSHESHLNSSFKLFYYFCERFSLLKEEDFKPLADFIIKMKKDTD